MNFVKKKGSKSDLVTHISLEIIIIPNRNRIKKGEKKRKRKRKLQRIFTLEKAKTKVEHIGPGNIKYILTGYTANYRNGNKCNQIHFFFFLIGYKQDN